MSFSFPEEIPRDCDRRGWELILGEDGSSARRLLRCDKDQVRLRLAGRLDAYVTAANQESLRVCARCRYESLLISGYGRAAIHFEFGEAANLDPDRLVAYKCHCCKPIRTECHSGMQMGIGKLPCPPARQG